MAENKKDEIRNIDLEELDSVTAGLFDLNKLSDEEMYRYLTLKNRFFDLLKLQAQDKCTMDEVLAAQKEVVAYSEELNAKYPNDPKDVEKK